MLRNQAGLEEALGGGRRPWLESGVELARLYIAERSWSLSKAEELRLAPRLLAQEGGDGVSEVRLESHT